MLILGYVMMAVVFGFALYDSVKFPVVAITNTLLVSLYLLAYNYLLVLGANHPGLVYVFCMLSSSMFGIFMVAYVGGVIAAEGYTHNKEVSTFLTITGYMFAYFTSALFLVIHLMKAVVV